MIPKEQWLTMHKVCLDTIRSVIKGLSDVKMPAKPVPGGDSIGDQVNHVIQAEGYWLREVQVEPNFQTFQTPDWTELNFLNEFDKIERQYQEILEQKGLDTDVLFGLGRVCQHALNHFVKMMAIRRLLEPKWEPEKKLRWARAVDFISDLLIAGEEAKPRYG